MPRADSESRLPPPGLWAGALSLLLRHNRSGCPHSARQAADLLDRLAAFPDLDDETRQLCEQESERLSSLRPTVPAMKNACRSRG